MTKTKQQQTKPDTITSKSNDPVADAIRIEGMKSAVNLLRKYLNKTFNKKSWLLDTITILISREEVCPHHPKFIFDTTQTALEHNARILEKYGFNFHTAIQNQTGSTIAPGSEFRPIKAVEQLWKFRKDWKIIEDILTNGCTYPLRDLPCEEIRL